MTLKRQLALAAMAIAGLAVGQRLPAQAIISSGNVILGVQSWGNLNVPDARYPNLDGSEGVGLRSASTGNESTFEGSPCEGWGAAVVGGANDGAWGGANESYGGGLNLTNTVFTSTPTSAISTTEISNVMRITHVFTPTATPYLYAVTVTLTNISGAVLGAGTDGIRYTRVMDWDIDPTPFAELVTVHGNGSTTNLLGTTDDGQSDPNPLDNNSDPKICSGNPANTDFVDVGPCDHGARFDLGFRALGIGQSRSFQLFYGVAPTEQAMFTALATVGAEDVYSFGQASNTDFCLDPSGGPGNPSCETFAFAFSGVGGAPIVATPEPASVALLASGLTAIGGLFRRRRAV